MSHRKYVLYFSLDEGNVKKYNKRIQQEELIFSYDTLFPEIPFLSLQDLNFYLDTHADILSSLHVIVDYKSLQDDNFREKNKKILRNIILSYPEVQFAFQEDNAEANFLGCLFDAVGKDLWSNLHVFNPSDELAMFTILEQNNNLFDASNLRYYLKTKLYKKLKVENNFSKIQDSRKGNLALAIDEEKSQSLFNAYVLYANGYRVLPINTARELIAINNEVGNDENPIKLIIRDYDLQFKDESGISIKDGELPKQKVLYEIKSENKNVEVSIDSVYPIRGFRFFCPDECVVNGNKSSFSGYKQAKLETDTISSVGEVKWYSLLDNNNKYWSNLLAVPTYFITKGNKTFVTKDSKTGSISIVENINSGEDENKSYHIDTKNNCLYLRGISKPINGIYGEIQRLREIKVRYEATRYVYPDVVGSETGEHRYEINTSRIENDHSTPLDIYDMVRSMVTRAEQYYMSGKYLYAAILSSEALEIMNGFHLTLMLKAYYINAVAENALAVRLLGANEDKLRDDTWFRLAEKVPQDLDRLCFNAPEFKKNILISIYNEARRFCKEKEHLESAEVALSLLVHLNNEIKYNTFSQIKKFFIRKMPDKTVTTRTNTNEAQNNLVRRKLRDFVRFVKGFPVSFIVLLMMIILSIFVPAESNVFYYILLTVYVGALLVLFRKPMQIIYGLIGTKGDISKFIFMFVFVVLCFATTYYNAFFKDSGVTYDVDLPQVEYHLFADQAELLDTGKVKALNGNIDVSKGRYVHCCNESFYHHPSDSSDVCHYYKRITFPFVLRQTFLTSLTTSPTDFFNSVSADYKNNDRNPKYTRLFNLILLYQILISWIFLGVFISLIYQKFRNE